MSARLGFVMLVHTALDRAAQVARFIAESGNPIVIHVDARVGAADHVRLKDSLKDLPARSPIWKRGCAAIRTPILSNR